MKRQKNLEVKKATILAMVVNSLQILMVGVIVLYMYMTPGDIADLPLARALVAVAAAVVIWGGVIDIRDALDSRKLLQQLDDMDQTIEAQEDLNITLRAQRHDFLNHLQVVYSLIEMKEYKEANDYIERVYGSIASVGKVLRTANPAINALLQVKLGVCEKAGIQVKLDIRSAWKDLSIPGWEMCKVLGNLLDNAIDALQEVSDRRADPDAHRGFEGFPLQREEQRAHDSGKAPGQHFSAGHYHQGRGPWHGTVHRPAHGSGMGRRYPSDKRCQGNGILRLYSPGSEAAG